MNLGFTILGYSIANRNRKDVVDFLVSNCILPDRSIANNIVSAVVKGADVSIYGESIDFSKVAEQAWEYEVISVPDGKYLIVSAVDFKLELRYSEGLIILQPTQSKEITYEDAITFDKEVKQGLVKIFPMITEQSSHWILRNGVWEDDKIWVDSEKWKY